MGFGGSGSGFQRAGDAAGPPGAGPRQTTAGGRVRARAHNSQTVPSRLCRMNGGRGARGGAAISGYRARHARSRARGSGAGAGLTRRGGGPCCSPPARMGAGVGRVSAAFGGGRGAFLAAFGEESHRGGARRTRRSNKNYPERPPAGRSAFLAADGGGPARARLGSTKTFSGRPVSFVGVFVAALAAAARPAAAGRRGGTADTALSSQSMLQGHVDTTPPPPPKGWAEPG